MGYHGLVSTYTKYKCRCGECVQAVRDYRARMKEVILDPDDHRHGTLTGYGLYGCRCDKCREANNAYSRTRTERRLTDPNDSRHGTTTGYTAYGCRCDPCRAAMSVKGREAYLKRTYNITLDEFEDKLAEQGGVCAICGFPESEGGKRFSVDHDHACCPGQKSCGRCVRGLLCHKCNTAIGLLADQPYRVITMMNYLEYYGLDLES